ncbi:MAG: GxxExxY protein [Phycisphaerae bacterium]|jgi:GxxExxY protein|nr:GxxExxY protein [Phycisphaerae bacterium]
MAEKTRLQYEEMTGAILRVAFDVSNELGCGFLEKVYENAMAIGLRAGGLKVAQQTPVRVKYLGQIVGDYIADMIVDNTVLVEIKATEQHNPLYVAQTLNYLKATGLEVGLLLNFGKPKLAYKRLLSKELLTKPDQHTGESHAGS